MNTQNLKRIAMRRANTARSLELHGPEHFNMATWFADQDDDDRELYDPVSFTNCGTTGCAAGHVVASNPSLRRKLMEFASRHDEFDLRSQLARITGEYIGLSHESGSCLFFKNQWPEWMRSEAGDVREWGSLPGDWRVVVGLMRWLAEHPEVDEVPLTKPCGFKMPRQPKALKRKTAVTA